MSVSFSNELTDFHSQFSLMRVCCYVLVYTDVFWM